MLLLLLEPHIIPLFDCVNINCLLLSFIDLLARFYHFLLEHANSITKQLTVFLNLLSDGFSLVVTYVPRFDIDVSSTINHSG